MLTEDKRKQLDTIISQMVTNKENDDTIQFVVNDFKNKYSVEEPETSFLEKTSNVLDMIFGGGKVGEAIGTEIAKIKAKPEEKEFVTPKPSLGEIAGSALQSAALFIPGGTIAKGLTGGVRALGLAKGASALGKIGSGLLAGEAFDVALNLQQGKTGRDALTPGLGTLIGGGLPAASVAKNVVVRFGERRAPRVINSLIKPLSRDFSYGKNPGRAVAEEGIVADNFDDLINEIKASRQKIGQSLGNLSGKLSDQPLLQIESALNPLDDAIKVATKQNNPTLLNRINNVKRAITEVLEPTTDDAGNLGIISVGKRDLDNMTFRQVRNVLSEIGDMTQFTGNPSDDKLVNSALKGVYGKIKEISLKYADAINPQLGQDFRKLTEKYADLHSAEIAAKYRDKIIERQNLVSLSPTMAGIGGALITAVATGGATIPTALVGLSSAVIDKLASTPGFKTRLAYMLSKKSIKEANFLFRKIPALSKFFSTKDGIFPGDIILGEKGEVLERKIAETIKNPKIGLTIRDVSKDLDPLAQDISKAKASGQSFDEWLKGQGEMVYHSTDSETFNVFDPVKATKGETFFNPLGDGLFLSSNKDFTRRFGKNTYEYILPKDAKTKIITDTKFIQDEYPAAVKGTLKKLGIKYDDLDLGDKVMINRLVENNPPIQALNEVEFFIKEDVAPKFGVNPKPNQVKDIMQGIMTGRNALYDAVIYRSTDYAIGKADEIIIPKRKVPTLKTRSQLKAEWDKITPKNKNLIK